jgi:hypothetical protein
MANKRMKTSSAKAKGRRLQQWVCKQISKATGIKWGKDCLIDSRPMGQSGTDTILIGEAQELYPFATECKNQERWDLPSYIKQAKEAQEKVNKDHKTETNWQVFLKKNRHEEIIIMDACCWFEIWRDYLNIKKGLSK